MIDETVTNPSVCLVTPADSSHKPKGMPNAKLGIAADTPKKIKLNCIFLISQALIKSQLKYGPGSFLRFGAISLCPTTLISPYSFLSKLSRFFNAMLLTRKLFFY